MVGNGSILKVAVEWKSHLWLQVSNLYREPSWSVPEDMLLLPETELPTASTHSSPAAIWLEHSRELGYKILLWPQPHVAKSGQSLSYSAMILLYGCVQCKAGSADLKEQVNISPNRIPIGRISCTEFGPRPVLQECVMTTTCWRILWNLILGLLEQVADAFTADPFTEWSGCSRAHISLVATSWQLLFHLWELLTRKMKCHYPNTCTRLDLQEVLADASFSTLLEWKLVHKYEVLLGGSVWLLQSHLCSGHQGLSSPQAEELLPKSQIPLWCPSDWGGPGLGHSISYGKK